MEKFGLGYAALSGLKPEIVMVSCSGFGRTGPMASHSAYMNTVAAFIGLTALNSDEGGQPMPVGATLSDLVAGTSMALASLLSLKKVRFTGRGSHVDLSMAEASMSLMGEPFAEVFNQVFPADSPERTAPRFRGVYPCLGGDKWIAISLRGEGDWHRLIDAAGNPEWARSYDALESQLANKIEIDRQLGQWTRQYDNVELTKRLQAAGVPALPSSDAEDVVNNPQFRSRGVMAEQDYHLEPGRIVPNLPWHFASLPQLDMSVSPPPLLGEHNREILTRLEGLLPELLEEINRRAAAAALPANH
jgi:crotonobetainyl-CoA:carnitine CoA-transferase CaiB-like acyl-CoA transferase